MVLGPHRRPEILFWTVGAVVPLTTIDVCRIQLRDKACFNGLQKNKNMYAGPITISCICYFSAGKTKKHFRFWGIFVTNSVLLISGNI